MESHKNTVNQMKQGKHEERGIKMRHIENREQDAKF